MGAYRDALGNEHDSEHDRDHVNSQVGAPSGGSGGGGGGGGILGAGGLTGAFVAIFIFGPIIFAKLVGLVWGLLLKIPNIGKVNPGKILTTAVVALLFLPFGLANFGMVGGTGVVETFFAFLTNVITWSIVLLIPAVYFCWHYDTVKAMGVLEFSNKLKKGAMIWWFGLIGVIILLFIKSGGNVGSKAEGIVAGIVIIAGLIYYFISTRPYARAVKEQNRGAKTAWKWLVVLVAFGLTVPLSISSVTAAKIKDAKYDAKVNKVVEARENLNGQTLNVAQGLTPNIYAEPSNTSNAIKRLSSGETVKATGNITKGVWIPIEAGSDKGYVFAPLVQLGDFSAFGKFPYPATITKAVNLESYYGVGATEYIDLSRGDVLSVLSKDGTFFVVEVKNKNYKAYADDVEGFIPKLNADGSIAVHTKPSAFSGKETPYQATVTETIRTFGWKDTTSSPLTIPAGTRVTVTGSGSVGGVNQASVSYNGFTGVGVYWWYLSDGNQSIQPQSQTQSESEQGTQSSIDEMSVSAVSATPDPSIPQANRTASSDIDAREFRGRNNQEFQFLITGTTGGRVWGSGPYTDDSNIARAAVHAGKLKNGETGWVTIRIMPGQSSYSGSSANGVETNDYGSFEGSFVFE